VFPSPMWSQGKRTFVGLSWSIAVEASLVVYTSPKTESSRAATSCLGS
jgi:hypothetical protein